jgi:hypothetical protein
MEILVKYWTVEEMNDVELTRIRGRFEKIGCCHGIVGDGWLERD